MNSKTKRYNYRAKEHRDWAAELKKDHQGCEICGRGKPGVRSGRPRKGQRLHAHHRYGTSHPDGVVLCPSCHKGVDLLAGHLRGVFLDPRKWRKFRGLVKDKIRGGPLDES